MDAGEVSNVNSELPIFGCNQAIAVIGDKEMAAGV